MGLFLLFLAPVLGAGYSSFQQYQREWMMALKKEQAEKTEIFAARLSDELVNSAATLKHMAQKNQMHDLIRQGDWKSISLLLDEAREMETHYYSIGFATKEGVLTAVSGGMVLSDRADYDKDLWLPLIRSPSWRLATGPEASDLSRYGTYFWIVAPVRDPSGEFLGAIIGAHSFLSLHNFTYDFSRAVTVDFQIFDENDRLVLHSQFGRGKPNSELGSLGARLTPGVTTVTSPASGIDYLASVTKIKGSEWTLVGYRPTTNAFARGFEIANQTRLTLGTLSALGFIFALALAYYINKTRKLYSEVVLNNVQLQLLITKEKEAVEKLQEADRAKNTFLSAVSHELKTPITHIMGYAGTLQRQGSTIDPALLRRAIEVINDSAAQLTRRVNDLLDLARFQEARLRLNRKKVNLDELLSKVKYLFSHNVQKWPIRLHLAPGLPPIYADPDRLEQVFSNLIDNAIKYSPEGGPIEISAVANGGSVKVAIRDHGIGIDAELARRIFDWFYRADSDIASGLGLGLTIAKALVVAHGGSISVESQRDCGATFLVSLPIAPEERSSRLNLENLIS